MKVVEVNKLYYPHIGGIEKVVQDIAEGLADKTDIEVLVCQPKGKTVIETINNVKVTRSGSIGTYFSMPISLTFLSYFKKLSKTADVMHIHMPFPLGDLACLMSGYKGKVVISWHSDVIKQKKLLKIYEPILNRFLKRVDCIIVATQGHIDSSHYLPKYIEKCRIVPYGLKLENYVNTPDSTILTDKLKDKSAKKLLFIGRLVYYKGVDILLESFAKTTGSELFIVGTGTLEDSLKTRTKDLGLEETVHFMGSLSDLELKCAIKDSDIFILPSVENSEAFGIVQTEAMIYGKPVINTSLPTGVPYVSIDGETGITVRPKDIAELAHAIQALTNDEQQCKIYGENAERRVREYFSMDKMLDDILEIYKRN